MHRTTSPAITTADLDYPLPEKLIATRPAEPRDSARMLVVHRDSDEVEHRVVRDLPEYVAANDVMIFNTTAVIPARLIGRRVETGGRIKGLFLEQRGDHQWLVMLRGRLKVGQQIELLDTQNESRGVTLELVEKREGGEWIIRVRSGDVDSVLEELGRTPLPPYILKARGKAAVDDALDRAWYQTVYADQSQRGSVAAPTAGLHFTPGLLAELDARGVERLSLTLHVGPGTFKPVTVPTLTGHVMHSERFEVPPETLDALRLPHGGGAKPGAGGRIIAVGTTTVRALESLPDEVLTSRDREGAVPLADARGSLKTGSYRGETSLLITPPYRFRRVDALMTNFHLPRSTLLALVAAFVGLDRLKEIYAEAVAREYRFYSYGDAMLIV